MADAGACLDAGNGGVLHTGVDQSGTAARDQQVDIAVGCHQLVRRCAGGVLDQQDEFLGKSRFDKTLLQGVDDRGGAFVRLFAAAQDADVAAL